MIPSYPKVHALGHAQIPDLMDEFVTVQAGSQEGVVVKNYNQFKVDGKVQMGKYVRPEFQETHKKSWKARNKPVLDVIASRKGRYGQIQRWLNGRWCPDTAHRVSYELFVGPIPEGYDVDHLCGQPLCVRPSHLEAVTPSENRRRENAGRERDHLGRFKECLAEDIFGQ